MRASVLVVLGLALCSSAFGQDIPKGEIFGGYSYLNIDTNGLSTSRESANGWEVSGSGNFNRWFAVEGSVAGYYKNILGVSVRDYSYAGGPRLNYYTGPTNVFAHVLIGGDHLSGSYAGVSASQDGFAAIFGGGVSYRFTPHWGIRGSADYVISRHDILAAQSYTQNNFRTSIGIVYVFGIRDSGPRVNRTTAPRQGCADGSEAALLGVTGCSSSSGFTVSSVRPGSPAATAGISSGDIVTSIDGRAVRTSQEIETAIAANASGTIKVGYMLKGSWATEREVKVR